MARPKKTERLHENELRDKILEKAEHLFAQNGFGSTTTRAIAESAQVNKNLIFYYFTNKAGLYQEVILRNIQPMFISLSKIISKPVDSEELLDRIVETYYNTIKSKPDIIPPLMLRELADGAPRFLEFFESGFNQVLPVIMQNVNFSTIRYLNPLTFLNIIGIVAYSFVTAPIQEAILIATNGDSPDHETRLSYLKTIVKHGILK